MSRFLLDKINYEILIVDDCQTTTVMIAGLLKQVGYVNPVIVHNFDDAVLVLENSSNTDFPVDLILMDVSMPGTMVSLQL